MGEKHQGGRQQQLWQEWREPAVTQTCSLPPGSLRGRAGATHLLPLAVQSQSPEAAPGSQGVCVQAFQDQQRPARRRGALWASCCLAAGSLILGFLVVEAGAPAGPGHPGLTGNSTLGFLVPEPWALPGC